MSQIVLFEFYCQEEATHIFVVHPDLPKPEHFTWEKQKKELREWAQNHFGASEAILRISEVEFNEVFREAADFIKRYTQPDDIIYLVPHDILHGIPFHALQVESRYLGERNPLVYVPSSAILQHCVRSRKAKKGGQALVAAYSPRSTPLAHATQQARSIASRYNTKALMGPEATGRAIQERFRDAAQRSEVDVLHLICHGTFAGGLQSHLTLADGKLTAEDFFSMELQTDLVTLGACESGVNEQRPGDELIGFSRALIYAGTSSVMVSLWRVEELSTNLLMQAFYDHWDNGQKLAKARALQKAQDQIRSITIESAIAQCEQSREKAAGDDEILLLTEDIANLYFRAHAYDQAEAQYGQLILMAGSDPGLRRSWEGMLHRCAYIRNKIGSRDDFDLRPYAHPYYWAPFILLGDWQ